MEKKYKPLSRRKLRQAAKLALAIHGYDLMQGFSHNEAGLSLEEYEIMTEEAHKLTEKLPGDHPMNLGSVTEVLNYFKEK